MSRPSLTTFEEPLLADLFAPDGPLARATPGYEPRPQQQAMAAAVWKSLEQSRHLLAEAGTGVGKSLAYLLPCALWSVRREKRVVVATYTKALQEQLITKDLPLVQNVLEAMGHSFRYALLMGSDNYLCVQRLQLAARRGPELFDASDFGGTVARLLDWSRESATGLRTRIPFEVPAPVWEAVGRDPEACLGRNGPYRDVCLYRKDIARAQAADLVVVNHHLFFAGVPFLSFDAVVFDEAHMLEELGLQFSGFSLADRPVKRLLEDVQRRAAAAGRGDDAAALWSSAVERTAREAAGEADRFFDAVRERLGLGPVSAAKRVRERLEVGAAFPAALGRTAALLDEGASAGRTAEEAAEFASRAEKCREAASRVEDFLSLEGEDNAYWVEVFAGRRGAVTTLNRAGLDVPSTLRRLVFDAHSPVILSSATLAVEDSFANTRQRLGLSDALEARLDSPFLYEEQAALYAAADIPDPKRDPAGYEAKLLDRCREIVDAVPGGVFILFTSRRLMERAHARLAPALAERPVFRQGERAPYELVAAFRAAGNGVLLGTDTFWQGVDVPGEALSCVILTRLPFPAPEAPLEEARQEWLAARGVDVFREYMLPKAVTKFRQGFGRLIRTKDDYGVVAVLDPRFLTMSYGEAFRRAVPPCRNVRSLAELRSFIVERRGGAISPDEDAVLSLARAWSGEFRRADAANVLRGSLTAAAVKRHGAESFGAAHGALQGRNYEEVLELIDRLIAEGRLRVEKGRLFAGN